MRDFLGNFSGRRISKADFVAYYTDVSASVSRDDYFEVMMKNSWNITGREGEANSKPLCVTVVLKNGKEENVEVRSAVGLRDGDFDKIRARLHKQGIHGVV